jgi:hypothetical protein
MYKQQKALKRRARASSDDVSEDAPPIPQSPTKGTAERKRKVRRMDPIIRSAHGNQTEKDALSREHSLNNVTTLEGSQQPKECEGGHTESAVAGEEESEDASQPVVSSRRRRMNRQVAEGKPRACREEQDDLDLELADLDTGFDSHHATKISPKSKRSADLKAYKRARSLRNVSWRLNKPPSQNSELEYDAKVDATTARDVFDTDTDDEDFIEQDTEDDVLAMHDDIPLRFSTFASMKLKDLWSYTIGWMVKKDLHSGLEEDEGFRYATERLNKEPFILVESLLKSASWTSDFDNALFLPYMEVEDAYDEKCGACNRHSASHKITFRSTNRDIKNRNASLDEHEPAQGSREFHDSIGCRMKEVSDCGARLHARTDEGAADHRVWFLGSTCIKNARNVHILRHWQYNLQVRVGVWLEKHNYKTSRVIEKMKNLSAEEQIRYALEIVQSMMKDGVVRQLWNDFIGSVDRVAKKMQKED